MSRELSDGLAVGGVPDARRMVLTGGDDELAVRAEGCAVDTTSMSRELSDGLAVRGVPDARRIVPTGGDDEPAVRAEGSAADHIRMPCEQTVQLSFQEVTSQ